MRMTMVLLCAGLALSRPAVAGEMTRGLEIEGGQNPFTALQMSETGVSDDGILELKVRATGAQELRGYGLVLHFDPDRYTFVEAREAGDNLLETGSGMPRLFLAAEGRPGQVAVGSMLVDGKAAAGDGALVTFRLRATGVPQAGDFQVSDAVLVDLSGQVDAVGQVEIADLTRPPEDYGLAQNSPNPFNPETTISFQLPDPGRVTLVVYNMLGQEVRRLVDEEMGAGTHTARWDGRDSLGRRVASGIYLYRMEAGAFSTVRRMALVK